MKEITIKNRNKTDVTDEALYALGQESFEAWKEQGLDAPWMHQTFAEFQESIRRVSIFVAQDAETGELLGMHSFRPHRKHHWCYGFRLAVAESARHEGIATRMLEYEAENISFYGNSAGGALCFAVCIYLRKYLPGVPLPGSIVSHSPSIRIPAAAKEQIVLGEEGDYGIGMLFLPVDTMKRMFAKNILTRKIMTLHGNLNDLLFVCKSVYDKGKENEVSAPLFYGNYEKVMGKF